MIRHQNSVVHLGLLLVLAGSVLLGGCSSDTSDATRAGLQEDQPAVSFVNKVWQVSTSNSVAAGQLYVFLSEGTLVIASPHGTPSFGTWTYGGGRLTITEEGRAYETDILTLSANEFGIRMSNPGEAVEITFAPAEQPLLPE